MATLIPNLNYGSRRMTAGERRLAERIVSKLNSDTLCWYDLPLGERQAHPDFILFHPRKGLLLLEVKDWKLETILSIDKESVVLNTDTGPTHTNNPLRQVRGYSHELVNLLKSDSHLLQKGDYQGQLLFPYGVAVVLSNITRDQFLEKQMGAIFPEHLVICKDEMVESVEDKLFEERLWGALKITFPCNCTPRQIDRVRWHLFPELRINPQQSLFDDSNQERGEQSVPERIRVMDLLQEQLARGMGAGHRVIHGVAGSGKTMILLYRAKFLAKHTSGNILIVCYNKTLAAAITKKLKAHPGENRFEIRTFHSWCASQLKSAAIASPSDKNFSTSDFYKQQVERVISAVKNGEIATGQYSAVLIDEGHDFEPEWLQLLALMPHPKEEHLLLLYDDAQSIYRRISFTFSSVGIKAPGRTSILRINYRNAVEITRVANRFAQRLLSPRDTGDDQIPVVVPELGGGHSIVPQLLRTESTDSENEQIAKLLLSLHQKGRSWSDCAIICRYYKMFEEIVPVLTEKGVPCQTQKEFNASVKNKKQVDRVTLFTMHSSKGLEFTYVFLPQFGNLSPKDDNLEEELRLHYVAITRAKEGVVVTSSADNPLVSMLEEAVQQQQ